MFSTKAAATAATTASMKNSEYQSLEELTTSEESSDATWPLQNLRSNKEAWLYSKYYLGPLTDKKAKEACMSRSAWFVYHQIEHPFPQAAPTLADSLQLRFVGYLFVVYRRNDNGEHELYQIRTKTTSAFQNPVYYVDYGDLEAPTFDSIFGLLQYYDNFGHLNVIDSHRFRAEVFPLWNRPSRVRTISEWSALSSECSWIPGDSIFDPTISSSCSQTTTVSSSTSDSQTTESTSSSNDPFFSNISSEGETDCNL